MKDWLIVIGMWLFVVAGFIAVGYTRFANPDMTETRLLMTYWPLYTVFMVGGVIVGVLTKFGHKK